MNFNYTNYLFLFEIFYKMSHFTDAYDTVEEVTDTGIHYFFMSEGKKDIVKAIHYMYVRDLMGKRVYNLGFGNYDPATDRIIDDLTPNNGDHYPIFHTVLSTIPGFFRTYPDAMMMVQGSDSTQRYIMNCRLTCKKKCNGRVCRNAHRRINLYRNYVEKNYGTLNKEYIFLGSKTNVEDQPITEPFQKGKNYYTILLHKIS